MYDNPIYRWRESMAIALSRLRNPPLHGYLAYRSISDYLNQHGLALSEDEAKPLPSPQELRALVFDGARMEALVRGAAAVAVDDSLPPVTLNGNEKGLADFYYLAFKLFGMHIWAFTTLYFVILAISVALFFLSFQKSPVCLLLIMLYLVANVYMLGFQPGTIAVPHNSRFFPVLSFLPAMHLFLLVLMRGPPRLATVAAATGQMAILYFAIFIREAALWQALAVLASPLLVFNYRPWSLSLRRPRLFPTIASIEAVRAWPAILVLAGLLSFSGYTKFAVDKIWYRSETSSHTFWDPVYAGLISASPELASSYLPNCASFDSIPCLSQRFGDNMVYEAVLKYLRERNEVPPEIAYVSGDGQIMINAFWNAGIYDRVVRQLVFQVVKQHPWLTLKTFVLDKPGAQLDILVHGGLFRTRGYLVAALVATGICLMVCTLVALTRYKLPTIRDILQYLPAVLFVCLFSAITTMIFPSVFILDTILYYQMLTLLIFIGLSLTAVVLISRRRWRLKKAQYTTHGME
jgi:hypothetical protein